MTALGMGAVQMIISVEKGKLLLLPQPAPFRLKTCPRVFEMPVFHHG